MFREGKHHCREQKSGLNFERCRAATGPLHTAGIASFAVRTAGRLQRFIQRSRSAVREKRIVLPFPLRMIVAHVSKLARTFQQPPFATGALSVGSRRVGEGVDFLACHLLCGGRPFGRGGPADPVAGQRDLDKAADGFRQIRIVSLLFSPRLDGLLKIERHPDADERRRARCRAAALFLIIVI
ncbi:MAG TPA: hypothetical protein VL402_05990 [Xanthobacteraceae bacterium]|nr:hypothetical protein [Xanthobacteraceae bacterium]